MKAAVGCAPWTLWIGLVLARPWEPSRLYKSAPQADPERFLIMWHSPEGGGH